MWIKRSIHLWILKWVSHELFNMQIRWDSTVNLKITCEFLHVWIHLWKISHVTSRLKHLSLLKWSTYLKGPNIREIYVTYRGPIGLTHSYNIGKSCDLQAYFVYTYYIKEHWDFRRMWKHVTFLYGRFPRWNTCLASPMLCTTRPDHRS